MQITVKELAKAAKISPRTLHYYDKIGLLQPAAHSSSGYRLYGEAELIKLQQISYLKQLGFSLEQIKYMLTHKQEIPIMLESQLAFLEVELRRIKDVQESVRQAMTDEPILTSENWQQLFAKLPEASEEVNGSMNKDNDLYRVLQTITAMFLKPINVFFMLFSIVGIIYNIQVIAFAQDTLINPIVMLIVFIVALVVTIIAVFRVSIKQLLSDIDHNNTAFQQHVDAILEQRR
ncbi:MerR family transcriptional regulator [Culicoidibacter larvae]|uniref:MerR family transcriptional regulator n=1 Tax=Culicoidibacter larvae TaxID=2579976 RepID=A0A5R8QFT4_9FIRM|nr:MerR family transcriptional regulator [Culicoidibacter larvae]TLG76606.1 MerR family transcriptional regulator [Culicoidibacter larvae]